MKNFSDYIPEELMDIPNVSRFIAVLDGAQLHKYLKVGEIEDSIHPKTLANIHFLRKYLYGLGQIRWIDQMPRKIYECLILNAFFIFSNKGTQKGFEKFVECMMAGTTVIDASNAYAGTFIRPSDFEDGRLPDLYEADACLKLFSDDVTDYYGSYEITIDSEYSSILQYRLFWISIIPELFTFI